MNRRIFFGATAGLAATGFVPAARAATLPTVGQQPTGPVTFYLEFRVSPPENEAVETAIRQMAQAWRASPGFLHLTLKQMVGDSTMVKNYPESYKGVLASAYLDGLKAQRQPYFYALFIRFATYRSLLEAAPDRAFAQSIVPHLHAITPSPSGPIKSAQPMAWYQGVFETIAAGNREKIVDSSEDVTTFLRSPADAATLTTVGNHVIINEIDRATFDHDVVALLKVAQQTYQPVTASNHLGYAGARDNRYYRKAVSTEILRNAFPDGTLRAYLMHGVWDSVWDHENSHLDPRFLQAAGPVGAAVVIGPVEPFYQTRLSIG
jgi:hypothetical protein